MATLKPLEPTPELACEGPGPMVVPLPAPAPPAGAATPIRVDVVEDADDDADDEDDEDLDDDPVDDDRDPAPLDLVAGLQLLVPAGFGRSAFWRHQRAQLAVSALQVRQVRSIALNTRPSRATAPPPAPVPVPVPVPAPPPAPEEHGGCEDVKQLSASAFSWMAVVHDIGVFLYDRRFVDPASVLAKLEGDAGKLALKLAGEFKAAGLPEAAARLEAVVAVAPFKEWVGEDVPPSRVQAELRERVLELLRLQCWLAGHVEDPEPAAPPVPGVVPAPPAPTPAAGEPRKAGPRRRA